MTLFETGMVAKLRVTNPNPEALTIDGASFKLILDDKMGTINLADMKGVD
jgi:LEA14-like dessication related protein